MTPKGAGLCLVTPAVKAVEELGLDFFSPVEYTNLAP